MLRQTGRPVTSKSTEMECPQASVVDYAAEEIDLATLYTASR
jgi:hypothetical protein